MSSAEGFDLDQLVADLRAAAVGPAPTQDVHRLLTEAVADPVATQAAMPDFDDDDVILFEDETVSIWHCRFRPGVTVPPHDHQIRATIGLYDGAERNEFFERSAGGFAKIDERVLTAGEVLQLEGEMIHAVSCAGDEPCCGIHVYLGALTEVERSLFDPADGTKLAFTDDNYDHLTARS